jgi:uncharacterized membrane protein
MPKSRLESFSDCVIAFAITLLVLDIHVQTIAEDINNPMMLQTLLGLVPQFSVYVIKLPDLYGLVDLHHALICGLDHVDPRLLWLNSLFLMSIVVLPLPTGLLGQHLRQPVAIALYVTVCTITCLTFALIRWYTLFPDRLLRKEVSDLKRRRDLRASLLFPAFYLAATAGGFFFPILRLLSYTPFQPCTRESGLSLIIQGLWIESAKTRVSACSSAKRSRRRSSSCEISPRADDFPEPPLLPC